MVGRKQEGEEEPEGEVILDPNGEAVEHSSGSNPIFQIQIISSITLLY